MATAAKIERVTHNREAIRNQGMETPLEGKTDDLNDPVVQARIFNPEGEKFKLSTGEITLFPLVAKKRREFTGFMARVMTDTFDGRERISTAFNVRLIGVLNQYYADEFLGFVAYALDKPGKIDADKARGLVAELENCQYGDLAILLSAMLNANDIMESITGKN